MTTCYSCCRDSQRCRCVAAAAAVSTLMSLRGT
jgi:hypothetical protein